MSNSFTSIESKLHNRSTLFYNTAFSYPIFATCKRRCCDCLLHDTCPFHDQCLLLAFQPLSRIYTCFLSKHLKSRDHRIYSAATSTLTILVTAFPERITDLSVASTSPNCPTEPALRPFAILKCQHHFNQWTCNLDSIPPPISPLSLEARIRDTVKNIKVKESMDRILANLQDFLKAATDIGTGRRENRV